jgi:hypothetical protein
MAKPPKPLAACPICAERLTDAVCPSCITETVLTCLRTALKELPPPFAVGGSNAVTVRGAIISALALFAGELPERTSRLLQHWQEQTIRAATRLPSVAATYVSVWDGGTTVRVRCRWSVSLQVAFEIDSVDVDGLESLDREYVELEGGIEIDVDSENETADGIPARAILPPAVGDVIHYLDIDSQPTTRSALIGRVGPAALHGDIWMVYAETGISAFVRRAFGRDGLAGGKAVWLEYFPG